MSWWHPCGCSSCCENDRGQCMSGGCDMNPMDDGGFYMDDGGFYYECRRDEDEEDVEEGWPWG